MCGGGRAPGPRHVAAVVRAAGDGRAEQLPAAAPLLQQLLGDLVEDGEVLLGRGPSLGGQDHAAAAVRLATRGLSPDM